MNSKTKSSSSSSLCGDASATLQHLLNILQKSVQPGRVVEAEMFGVKLRVEGPAAEPQTK